MSDQSEIDTWFEAFTLIEDASFDLDVYVDIDGLHLSQPSEPELDDVVHVSWAQFATLIEVVSKLSVPEELTATFH